MKAAGIMSFCLVMLQVGGISIAAKAKNVGPISEALVALCGTDSHMREPSYERVNSPNEMAHIWSRHSGTSMDDAYASTLEVDFDRCTVVAIFRGEERQVRNLRVDSISERTDAIVVRLNKLGYGIALRDGEEPPPPERPYAFVVVPKTEKPIVVEESHPLKGPTVEYSPWVEWARIK